MKQLTITYVEYWGLIAIAISMGVLGTLVFSTCSCGV